MLFKVVPVGYFEALECRRILVSSFWCRSGTPRRFKKAQERPLLGPKTPKTRQDTPKIPQDCPRSPKLPFWNRLGPFWCRFKMFWNLVGASFVEVVVLFWGGGISRAAAVFYNTAAAWTELEMLPKAVQFSFLFDFAHDLFFQN